MINKRCPSCQGKLVGKKDLLKCEPCNAWYTLQGDKCPQLFN